MKKAIVVVTAFISLNVSAQSPVLAFDGIDDYVDLGPDAGTGARTVALWFNFDNSVDSTLSHQIIFVGTEVPDPNVDEWHAGIGQTGTVNPAGAIRFSYVISNGLAAKVFSNNNFWNANQWYHVAVVIDPVD